MTGPISRNPVANGVKNSKISADKPFKKAVPVPSPKRDKDTLQLTGRSAGVKSVNNPEIIKKIIPETAFLMRKIDPVARLTRLDEARKVYDYTGRGVGVAVIDSGFSFPGIKPRAWLDLAEGSLEPNDPAGHGTHVTGDVLKMAPGADLTLIKVGDRHGKIKNSNLVKAVQWVIDHKDQHGIKVINLSTGHLPEIGPLDPVMQSPPYFFKEYNPVEWAVEKAVEAGITVVCAAGNEAGEFSVITPAVSPRVIAVGSALNENTVSGENAGYYGELTSSQGPTFDGVEKPDLLAPGEGIVSLSSARINKIDKLADALSCLTPDEQIEYLENSPELFRESSGSREKLNLPKNFPKLSKPKQKAAVEKFFAEYNFVFKGRRATDPDDGTSYASPQVAGLAALLYEAKADLTPDQVKEILTSTCRKVGKSGPNTQGAGLIDVKAALDKVTTLKKAE